MQQTNLYTVTVPPMVAALTNLCGLIGKAAAHAEGKKSKVEQLLNDRLVFDQFDLKKQVQVATNAAKRTGALLSGAENPVFEDDEQTPEELKARIGKTIAFLETLKEADFAGKEGISIEMYFMKDRFLSGFDYAVMYAMPNFYFHVTTAYSILRKNGVDVGKTDYLGALPYRDTPPI